MFAVFHARPFRLSIALFALSWQPMCLCQASCVPGTPNQEDCCETPQGTDESPSSCGEHEGPCDCTSSFQPPSLDTSASQSLLAFVFSFLQGISQEGSGEALLPTARPLSIREREERPPPISLHKTCCVFRF